MWLGILDASAFWLTTKSGAAQQAASSEFKVTTSDFWIKLPIGPNHAEPDPTIIGG